LSIFESEQNRSLCVCVPLNANELLLQGKRAELQELVCVCSSDYLTQTSTEMSVPVLPFMFKLESNNDGETRVECNIATQTATLH